MVEVVVASQHVSTVHVRWPEAITRCLEEFQWVKCLMWSAWCYVADAFTGNTRRSSLVLWLFHVGGGKLSVLPSPSKYGHHIKGFHVGDARVKKLKPASKRSIGHHVEFWRARQKFWRRPTARHQRENPYCRPRSPRKWANQVNTSVTNWSAACDGKTRHAWPGRWGGLAWP